MKKLVLLIASVVCMGFYANAQTASGTCKLPGTYDYVNVDYYESDGHLAVSNQSGMRLTQLRITVKCTITYEVKNNSTKQYETKTETVTVCDKNFYDIAPNQTTTLSDGVKSRKDIDIRGNTKAKYEYTVTVGNPICK